MTSRATPTPRSWPYLWPGLAVLLAVYRFALLPGVGYTGDTAKFQFLGKVLGTPHPTGYPLYLVLNHLFVTAFPWGSLAFRANLLSALFAVGACGVLFLIVRRLGVRPWPAAVAMLAFGFTPMFWSQSLVAEVYSLNALFVMLLVHELLAWSQSRDRRRLWAAVFVFALSLGNHMTMVLLLPPAIVFVLLAEPQVARDRRTIVCVLAAAVVGVGQYGYLIWRNSDPTTAFLEVHVPGLREMWQVMTGGQFKVRMFPFAPAQVLGQRVPMVGGLLWRELGLLLPVAVLGLAAARHRRFMGFILGALVCNLVFTINYDIPDIQVYVIPAVALAMVPIAAGLQNLVDRVGRGRLRPGPVLLAAIPAVMLVTGYPRVSQRHNTGDARRIEQMLRYVDRDALLVGLDYHDFNYVTYYLIGEQWQKERRIYAVNQFRHWEFMELFRDGVPITLDDQRINTPAGLTVYVQDVGILEGFRKEGVGATEVGHGLWRIDAPAR